MKKIIKKDTEAVVEIRDTIEIVVDNVFTLAEITALIGVGAVNKLLKETLKGLQEKEETLK
jgi:hypothetical protein